MGCLKLLVPLFLLVGCSKLPIDGYRELFTQVHVGDSAEKVVLIMGQPDATKGISLPFGIEVSQLTYRSLATKQTYVVQIVSGQVVAKETF